MCAFCFSAFWLRSLVLKLILGVPRRCCAARPNRHGPPLNFVFVVQLRVVGMQSHTPYLHTRPRLMHVQPDVRWTFGASARSKRVVHGSEARPESACFCLVLARPHRSHADDT